MAEDTKNPGPEGQSFHNEALTGSGTILPDGTYGEPQPDPTVQRGGVTDGRTSPGGVKRPDPNELIPPAREATETKSTTSKPRNTRS